MRAQLPPTVWETITIQWPFYIDPQLAGYSERAKHAISLALAIAVLEERSIKTYTMCSPVFWEYMNIIFHAHRLITASDGLSAQELAALVLSLESVVEE